MCVCVCESRHPYTPRCTSVEALYRWAYDILARDHIRTFPWNLRAHSYTCTYSYVRCMHVVIHVSWARACAAPDARARTYAHARTLAWNLHLHTYAHTCTHTETYPQGDTHLISIMIHELLYIPIYTHTYIYKDICVYIYVYAHPQTHTYTHT